MRRSDKYTDVHFSWKYSCKKVNKKLNQKADRDKLAYCRQWESELRAEGYVEQGRKIYGKGLRGVSHKARRYCGSVA